MIKVIEHGNKEFVMTCSQCECKFSYESSDIHGDLVTCPDCGKFCVHKGEFAVKKKFDRNIKIPCRTFGQCEHEWKICNEVSTAGYKYYCPKCGTTKIVPYGYREYTITLD